MTDTILDAKLKSVRILEAKLDHSISLDNLINISCPPESKRCSFPYSVTPFLQSPSKLDLETDLKCTINEIPYNRELNCSGSSEGVCYISKTLEMSNSHAGTHADQPRHFLESPDFESFDDLQYNGQCLVVSLVDRKSPTISLKELTSSVPRDFNFDNLTRILIKTYSTLPLGWDDHFAHLSIECAKFLGNLPNLLLVGIDTPSIDHPSASPIIKCSHGSLWNGRVAILENLNLISIPPSIGFLKTIWNRTYSDSKQCICLFSPIKSL